MATSQNQPNIHPKLYEIRGAQYSKRNKNTTFRVYAPNARCVLVILTSYGREMSRLAMQKADSGLWETVTDKVLPGATYLYLVDNCNGKKMLRTDPVSFSVVYVPEVNQVHSIVHDHTVYQWSDQLWMQTRARTDPLRSPLSIYELQLKSWKNDIYHPLNYRQLAPELATYCQQMGFTHVEIFGILDHAYKPARGYQVANYFAPYRDNGICDDLKFFVDHLHQNNIGIILDWIPTHFQHYHQSDSFSISLHEFDGTNLYADGASAWGTLYFDFNKEETCRLLFASALYFLDVMHMDGIRFDAVSAMIRRRSNDIPAAIVFLRNLNKTIHRCYPGVLCIAEETDGYRNLTKIMDFDLKWNIGWSFDARNLLRTPYNERSNHWQQKVLNILNAACRDDDKTILTLSHDDTDSGEHNSNNVLLSCVSHSRNDSEKFADLRNFFAWQTLAPSRGHMIHMGDELVQPMSWYQHFRQGRSSVDWSLVNTSSLHRKMQEYIADLNRLYQHHQQFWQNGEQDFSMIYEYGPNLIVAYHRGTYDKRRMAVIHNFSNCGYSSYDISLPSSDSAVRRIQNTVEIFNSDNPVYGGSGLFQNPEIEIINSFASRRSLRLAIPPLATLILEEYLS
ncbi:unnamed protein product [Rotaria magnacalcarata]|uniref:1,4-alpha-glucan branching enzyme n=1 Tax=Rotaria magnacalcarata TaxID=392030 RepID=A0A815KF09_9BILA|nr:unnamed protein product [Rotaria magnacalcarata]CAF1524610.1 unnamed protein product [Rotaria magnacalcarata]CAF3885280.1 unnamed protein product [Rotaria magnacalcarata]CAF3937355.1 unnamed protein product [Rotaria magnacalcarata]